MFKKEEKKPFCTYERLQQRINVRSWEEKKVLIWQNYRNLQWHVPLAQDFRIIFMSIFCWCQLYTWHDNVASRQTWDVITRRCWNGSNKTFGLFVHFVFCHQKISDHEYQFISLQVKKVSVRSDHCISCAVLNFCKVLFPESCPSCFSLLTQCSCFCRKRRKKNWNDYWTRLWFSSGSFTVSNSLKTWLYQPNVVCNNFLRLDGEKTDSARLITCFIDLQKMWANSQRNRWFRCQV